MDAQQTECASILMTTICMSEIAAIIYAGAESKKRTDKEVQE